MSSTEPADLITKMLRFFIKDDLVTEIQNRIILYNRDFRSVRRLISKNPSQFSPRDNFI